MQKTAPPCPRDKVLTAFEAANMCEVVLLEQLGFQEKMSTFFGACVGRGRLFIDNLMHLEFPELSKSVIAANAIPAGAIAQVLFRSLVAFRQPPNVAWVPFVSPPDYDASDPAKQTLGVVLKPTWYFDPQAAVETLAQLALAQATQTRRKLNNGDCCGHMLRKVLPQTTTAVYGTRGRHRVK